MLSDQYFGQLKGQNKMSDLKKELLDLYSKNPNPEGWSKEECVSKFRDL